MSDAWADPPVVPEDVPRCPAHPEVSAIYFRDAATGDVVYTCGYYAGRRLRPEERETGMLSVDGRELETHAWKIERCEWEALEVDGIVVER